MKKQLLAATLLLMGAGATAQQRPVITDTVSIGSGYANEIWYSLANDEQGSRVRNDWDLAFDLKNFTSGLISNSASGVMVWKYKKGTIANGWRNIDTAGLSTWEARYNSDTSWAMGAVGRYADPNNPVNLDWGNYNMSNHTVTGDSLFIVKLANGQYKKFAVESLISGVFTYRYADLNDTGRQVKTVAKSAYAGKNFAYLNLATGNIVDREPLSANWDLLFTQYTTFLGIPYGVTGVLSNMGVRVARASGLPDKNTYTNYAAHSFSSAINMIGYNWKSFTGTTYAIKDSQVYFVKAVNGDIWKMIFTGFGGSTNGSSIFSKQLLNTASTAIGNVPGNTASVAIFPNPARTQNVHLAYDFKQAVPAANLAVYDLAGRTVFAASLDANAGLHQFTLPAAGWQAGMYLISVETAYGRVQQKLIVQ